MSSEAGITIRLTRNPPITIEGGITRWRIHAVPQGKNGSHIVVACDCLD